MPKKAKKSKKQYVVFCENDPYEARSGTLKECEKIASEWFLDAWGDQDIIIGEVVPIKKLESNMKPEKLPWIKLSDGCTGG